MTIKWTSQQHDAITTRLKKILVAASAGTGKTAVLSARCTDIVSDKDLCPSVWNMLVLTFTEAAAEEMRNRIAAQLWDQFRKTRDCHLRHQLLLLQAADISTIHSFCKKLITEHFYELSLDPEFSIIDNDEQFLLKAEALDKTVEWAWQQPNLAQALKLLLTCRDLRLNDGFLSRIITISDFLDSLTSRSHWLERATALAEITDPLKSPLGTVQIETIKKQLKQIIDRIDHAFKIAKSHQAGDWAEKYRLTTLAEITTCLELMENDQWTQAVNIFQDYKKPRINKPKIDEDTDKFITNLLKDGLSDFQQLSELAVLNPHYQSLAGSPNSLQVAAMTEMIRKFHQLYTASKRNINCLDFSDLEHLALQLLTAGPDENGQLKPSKTALALREKYSYIMVDEYQDINPVQKVILEMVGSSSNDFLVGDVKQSIYAFRGAEPKIFLSDLDSVKAATTEAKRIDLNTNFRSDPAVLEFVNKIFERIMTIGSAEMDYDQAAKLKSLPDVTPNPGTAVEMHIIDEKTETCSDIELDDFEANFTKRQHQASLIARRVRQLVGADTGQAEMEITDKATDQKRPLCFSDIVILMRSPLSRSADYAEILQLAGIPVTYESFSGFFDTTEMRDCLSLLKIIDNPQRDIELAAVLRSPFFGFTDSQLKQINDKGKTPDKTSRDFYSRMAALLLKEPETELAKKVSSFFDQLRSWRDIARQGRLADLIWQIIRPTSYLSFVTALPNGSIRKNNLLKLHDRAIQFENFISSGKTPSLARFVEFITTLQDCGRDWSSSEPAGESKDAVRIMSVHKSKGLEFPVVFLAELNSQFNTADSKDACLIDPENTIGINIIDPVTNQRTNSLAHQVIAEKKKTASFAEEMRVLYVALTRAREKLILTASFNHDKCKNLLQSGSFFTESQLPVWQIHNCKSPIEWLLYCLSDQNCLHRAFDTGHICPDQNLLTVTACDSGDIDNLLAYTQTIRNCETTTPENQNCQKLDLEKIKSNLNWKYPYNNLTELPTKISVTALTHDQSEFSDSDFKFTPPTEKTTAKVDSKALGTAAHLLISELDLSQKPTIQSLQNLRDDLLDSNQITPEVAGALNLDSILQFFQSPLSPQIFNPENTVNREWPFTFAIDHQQWQQLRKEPQTDIPAQSDEKIIVQGIIDMLIKKPDSLLIIDFKTDNITAAQADQRAAFYKAQVDIYSQAASAILKKPVAEKYIYFLKPGICLSL